MRSALYTGVLAHAREAPSRNAFSYPVYQLLLDLDELDELDGCLALFGNERRRPVSVRAADHLGDPARPIAENVRAYLAGEGVDLGGGRIELLTNPRTFGHVFNPVSFYWCRRPDERVACVVAEVHNTFGERWCYLLRPGQGGGPDYRFAADKVFHVSPFFVVEGSYRFRMVEPGETAFVRIDHLHGGRTAFRATLSLRREELTAANLRRALLRHPLMTAQISARIRLQALNLWRKRVPFHGKPTFHPELGSRSAP